MKKGDTVSKDTTVELDESLAHGFDTEQQAEAWMRSNNTGGAIKPDDMNEGKLMVVARNPHIVQEQALVEWVIGDEFALRFNDGAFKIVNTKNENGWKVIRESVPTYQSSVASMSDEALRASIDGLRRTRVVAPKKVRKGVKREKVDNSPMAKVLAGMSPEKKKELMVKLGMSE